MQRYFHEKPGVEKLLGTVEVVNCTQWSFNAPMAKKLTTKLSYLQAKEMRYLDKFIMVRVGATLELGKP